MKTLLCAALSLVFLTILSFSLPTIAPAQADPGTSFDKSKLLVQPRGERSESSASLWREPVVWLQQQQRAFYGSMSGAMRDMKGTAPLGAAMTLILLSFGYGIFHAAGPGHGKAVISAWLVATEIELRRGILVAFMSAFVQALTAIAIVSILLLIVTTVGSTARDVAGFLESASYLLIAVMGGYLIWTAFRPAHAVAGQVSTQLHHEGEAHHGHGHDHDYAHAHLGHSHGCHHDHRHHHHHSEECDCGHAHLPSAAQVKGEWTLAKASSLAVAVGIRPCSGAILALIFANAIGLYWAGVISTLVMAVGTAITVSIIATLTVYSKRFAVRLAKRDERWLGYAALAARICAGVVIVGLGGLLFWGSLGTVNTSM